MAAASLEERIGGTWLVRIGVVALLTGLALGVGWLYQNVVPHLGPGGKVALLYVVAGALTGAGLFLERRAVAGDNPALRNYARVLLGGGLAAVYFVTYAAGFLPGLRVIASPWLAGALLLAWTGFMAWTADRRGSETLATFALLLAYYTSAVNPTETFTLGANAVLTLTAVVLARRHRWTVFSFVALLATYGAYGFWRLAGDVRPAVDAAHFWLETGFLATYWALFTAAAFVVPAAALSPRRRAAFLATNHGALFALVACWVRAVYPGHLWQWALGFGVVLIALGEARRVGLEPASAGVSRVLGIVFATFGLAAYYDGQGWVLALSLAAESVVLLLAAEPPAITGKTERDWVNRTQLGLAGVAALGAFVCAGWELVMVSRYDPRLDPRLLAKGLVIVAALLFDAAWVRRRERMGAALFAGLGLGVGLLLLRDVGGAERFATALALGAVVVTVGLVPALRVGAVAAFGGFYLLFAIADFVSRHAWVGNAATPAWWETAAVAGSAVALCHWWQHSKAFAWEPVARGWAQGLAALGAAFTLDAALRPNVASPGTWMALGAGLALAAAGYGLATRSLALGAAGQIFLLTAAGALLERALGFGRVPLGERWPALAPALAALAIVTLVRRFVWPSLASSPPSPMGRVTRIATAVYEWFGAVLFAVWTTRFVAADGRFVLLAVVGAATVAAGVWFHERRWTWQGVALAAVGLGVFLEQSLTAAPARLTWWDVPGLLALATAGQFARRGLAVSPGSGGVLPRHWLSIALTFAAALAGWRWLTDGLTARVSGGGWTLAAGWSAYAATLFGAGLALRDRHFRWLGLGILGVTLGRIALVEFWNADTPHRILSLLAFSVVLLGLGFVYNRFGAKLRDWL